MLKQLRIKIGNATAFIDQQSDLCHDGKPCDTNGDVVYQVNGKTIRERDFKQYRQFSPQYRQRLIGEHFQSKQANVQSMSCSCSKCGTVAIDESDWF